MSDTRYVRGADKLRNRLNSIRASLAIDPLMQSVENLLVRRTLDRFEKEVDPDGVPWRPLAQATLARRRRRGIQKREKILQETEAMRRAIRRIRGSAAGLIASNTGAGFRIGVDDPEQTKKAAAHQYGTAEIPQRRFLGIGALDVKAVDSLLRRRAVRLDSIKG